MSETTPLLSAPTSEIAQTDDVYNRFSRKQKRVIVAVIAFAGVISRLVDFPPSYLSVLTMLASIRSRILFSLCTNGGQGSEHDRHGYQVSRH